MDLQYTQLGERGPRVSTMGFGAWGISGMDWGKTDDEVSKRAIHAALDEGITLIDTADNYGRGHSEKLIAEVMKERGGKPDNVVIATKAGNDFYNASDADDQGYGAIKSNAGKDYIIFAAEQSLKRLNVDALDILQLHSQPTDMLRDGQAFEALAILKEQGKIKAAGWSVQSFKETESAPLVEQYAAMIDTLQVRYNLLERQAEEALFPAAQKHGIGVIVRIPILFGLLTGKFDRHTRFGEDDHRRMNLSPEKLDTYLSQVEAMKPFFAAHPDETMAQVSLRFCITHPACHCAIPGAKTPGQVRDNARASALGPLKPEEVPALP